MRPCDRTSTAAIGVAAHEAGHAIQYAQGYLPIKIRNAIIPVTNIGSRLALPLILIGLLFAGEGGGLGNLAYLGVLCFGLSTLFQLITLPVEFDASRRALRALESTHILTGEELYGARKVPGCVSYPAFPAAGYCQQEKWEKMTLRILAMVEIICYNAVRQNVKGVHGDTKNENPGGCDSGVFYSILGGWLMP